MRKLYDCFSLYQEKELLDLRIHHLYDVVDKFVIVEGDRTFAGKEIPCFFDSVRDEYDWAKDKIIHVRVKLKAEPKDRWENEAIQRDGFIEGITDAQPDDLILINCIDEIPRTEMLEEFKKSEESILTLLELQNFYYYFNGKDIGPGAIFPCPVLTSKKNITHGTHALWDNRYNYVVTPDAGWHFSFLGGVDAIKKKLEAFSHSEFDTDYYKDPKRLEQVIANGGDIFERPEREYEFVSITPNSDFPDYLIANKKKYRHLIY